MNLRTVRESSLADAREKTGAFIAACGYEHRSSAISRLLNTKGRKVALCFTEFGNAIARSKNEVGFIETGFETVELSGNDSVGVQRIVGSVAEETFATAKALTFDVSSMTRAWHGGIVRQLRSMDTSNLAEVMFAYVPAVFRPPGKRTSPNEFVEPVQGFASLATPDLPVAVIIGLGYERGRALGIQQILDPERTFLFLPKSGDADPFYSEVLRGNRDILSRTVRDSVFDYSLAEPAATFSTLASIIGGLREQYRVVLISFGPKIFGVLCFLLATRFPDVSVWRVSSGVHGRPRDAEADLGRLVVLSTIWGPAVRSAD